MILLFLPARLVCDSARHSWGKRSVARQGYDASDTRMSVYVVPGTMPAIAFQSAPDTFSVSLYFANILPYTANLQAQPTCYNPP